MRVLIVDAEDSNAWPPGHTFADLMEVAFTSKEDDVVARCFIARGDALPPLSSFDAMIVTGSHYNVRDAPSWQAALAGCIRSIYGAGRDGPRLLGICYGHQLVADTLGGQVGLNGGGSFVLKAEALTPTPAFAQQSWADSYVSASSAVDGGTTVGVRDWNDTVWGGNAAGTAATATSGSNTADGGGGVASTPPPCVPYLRLLESHGDCVTVAPLSSTLLASSPSCPTEMLAYADGRIVTVQGHPEFELQSCILDRIWPAVVEQRRRLSPTDAEVARASFALPLHSFMMRAMLRAFLRGEGAEIDWNGVEGKQQQQ